MKAIFKKDIKFETGLILSGGAARGFAHLGVMQALREYDIIPEIISGVSAGAIVGAFYADGYSPVEIMRFFHGKKLFDLVEFTFRRSGFMRITGLKKILVKNLRAKTFEDLRTPFYITVTNMRTGRPEYINKGNLIEAILASSSIPVLFHPTQINGDTYIDGGITDNFPVFPIKDSCKKIIGVHVNPIGEEKYMKGITQIAVRSFHLSVASGLHDKKKFISLFIEPMELRKFGLLDVTKGIEMFEIGYKYTKKILEEEYMHLSA